MNELDLHVERVLYALYHCQPRDMVFKDLDKETEEKCRQDARVALSVCMSIAADVCRSWAKGIEDGLGELRPELRMVMKREMDAMRSGAYYCAEELEKLKPVEVVLHKVVDPVLPISVGSGGLRRYKVGLFRPPNDHDSMIVEARDCNDAEQLALANHGRSPKFQVYSIEAL